MFLIRYLISIFLWLTIWIPIYLLGFLVGWMGLLFCNRDSEHMPKLWWFWDNETHGINGTLGGNNPKWVLICNPEVFPEGESLDKQYATLQRIVSEKSGKERTFWNRWVWLYWRNPVTNISLYTLGVKIKDKPINVFYRNWFNKITFSHYQSGPWWCYILMFQYSNTKSFFHVFGWKLLDLSPEKDGSQRARFMFRISPLYTGKMPS